VIQLIYKKIFWGIKFKKGEKGEIIVLLHMLIKNLLIKKKKGKKVIFYTCQIEFK
jgi:hypothetical protein